MQLRSAILSVQLACIRPTHRQALNQLPRLALLQVVRESGQDLMNVACCSASLAPAAVWLLAQTAAVEDRTPAWLNLQDDCSFISIWYQKTRSLFCLAFCYPCCAARTETRAPWAYDKGTTRHARASQHHSALAAVPS